VLGCTGSAVLRQVAEDLTPLWFSQWRTEAAVEEVADRHIKLTAIWYDALSSPIGVFMVSLHLGRSVSSLVPVVTTYDKSAARRFNVLFKYTYSRH
jgi:hypothetical protein